MDAINGVAGPWILVDGHIRQKDAARGFELWTLLRGLFVKRRDVTRLRDLYMSIQYPGNLAIPQSGEDHYVFGGEIGRSPRYAPELMRANGSYRRQTSSAFEEYKWIPDPAVKEEPQEQKTGFIEQEDGTLSFRFSVPRGRSQRIPGVRVELPARSFSWESYHSAINYFSGFDVPAPSLIARLKLHTKKRDIDFYDESERQATAYREEGSMTGVRRLSLLYVREDLLKRYLRETRQTLVWCNWGERNYTRGEDFERDGPPDVVKVLQDYGNVHRRFVTLDEVSAKTSP